MTRHSLFLALLLLPLLVTPGWSQDWTRFRGPNGSGVSDAKTIPVRWTEEDYNWSVELPGRGHSSPVIWGPRLFVTSSDLDAGERFLICVETSSGKILWQQSF